MAASATDMGGWAANAEIMAAAGAAVARVADADELLIGWLV